jgi:hypothetical protein
MSSLLPVIIVELLPVGNRKDNPYKWWASFAFDIHDYQVGRTREEALERLKDTLFGKLPSYRKSTEFTSIDLDEFLVKEVHEL